MKEYVDVIVEVKDAREKATGIEAEILGIADWLLEYAPVMKMMDPITKEIHIDHKEVLEKVKEMLTIAKRIVASDI